MLKDSEITDKMLNGGVLNEVIRSAMETLPEDETLNLPHDFVLEEQPRLDEPVFVNQQPTEFF